MSREDIQTNIRLPEDLKHVLNVDAAVNRRSLTAEIVARLQASYERPPGAEYPALVKAVAEQTAKRLGVSFNEALCILVAAGDAKDAPHVTYMRIPFGTRYETVQAANEALKQFAPSGSVQYGDSGD